jgi:hypothetical protein
MIGRVLMRAVNYIEDMITNRPTAETVLGENIRKIIKIGVMKNANSQKRSTKWKAAKKS